MSKEAEYLGIFIKTLTNEPGVYCMLDDDNNVLYVGKAANLQKRVSSYFHKSNKNSKIQALVSQIARIDIHVTQSEIEAFLLESNLIKTLRPKYNVLMRDDKSYPYIEISVKHDYPGAYVKRTKKKPINKEVFGPYPSATAVRETMNLLQKVFKIRNCSDSYFNARSRPCLQYQIKRCSAPCTGYISKQDYKLSVQDAMRFLKGMCREIIEDLSVRMQDYADKLDFEAAALLRDKIRSLRLIQERQNIVKSQGDVDVVVIYVYLGFACVQLVSVRNGDIINSENFFPVLPSENITFNDEQLWQQVFNTFIAYYYFDNPDRIPKLIITDHDISEKESLQLMLGSISGKSCTIKNVSRGKYLGWLEFAINNLNLSVSKYDISRTSMQTRVQSLLDFLQIPKITRMECFDISHMQGDSTVASCVVFDEHGPCKSEYRRFNINHITKGDDYAAMEQALSRRYSGTEKNLPEVLIVDGGKGQVNVAKRVLSELNIDTITILGVAKGPSRKAGLEHLILAYDNQERSLPSDSKALHLIQHIRDESHRFAISSHRKKRQTLSLESKLENIPGIGSKRRQNLLRYFGGIREIRKASLVELEKVSGISANLAKQIYYYFH